MRRRTLLFSAVLLALAACGEERGAGTEPGPEGDLAALELVATDYALDPAEGRVDRPGTVRIRFVNEGDVRHALAVQGPTGAIVTAPVDPGDRTTLRAELPPGTYKWSCPLSDHEQRGMKGTLRVAE